MILPELVKHLTHKHLLERVRKGIKLGYLDESIEAQEMLAVIKKLNENPRAIDKAYDRCFKY